MHPIRAPTMPPSPSTQRNPSPIPSRTDTTVNGMMTDKERAIATSTRRTLTGRSRLGEEALTTATAGTQSWDLAAMRRRHNHCRMSRRTRFQCRSAAGAP